MNATPELDSLLSAPAFVGKSGKVIRAGGISTRNNLAILQNLCMHLQPARTLEIGLGPGGSALVFADYHQHALHPLESHTAIDPYQLSAYDDAAIASLKRAGLDGYVRLVRETSDTALPAMVQRGERFGLIYNDGSHLFEDTMVDTFYCHQLLDVGGVVVMDDCTDIHVRKVIRFIQSNWSEYYKELDLLPFREAASSTKYKLARFLRRIQCRAFMKIKDGRRCWVNEQNQYAPLGKF